MTVTGDGTDEPDETVTVVLSGPVNATLSSTATGTGTITDDDGAPAVTLALSSSSIAENGGAATVTATLSHASSAATTVTVTADDGLLHGGFGRGDRDCGGEHRRNATDVATVTAVDNTKDEPIARRR